MRVCPWKGGISSLAGPAYLWSHCLSFRGERWLGQGMEWGVP